MRLCRELGKTLGELLDQMTAAEFELWIGLWKIEALEEAERQVRAKAQAIGGRVRGR